MIVKSYFYDRLLLNMAFNWWIFTIHCHWWQWWYRRPWVSCQAGARAGQVSWMFGCGAVVQSPPAPAVTEQIIIVRDSVQHYTEACSVRRGSTTSGQCPVYRDREDINNPETSRLVQTCDVIWEYKQLSENENTRAGLLVAASLRLLMQCCTISAGLRWYNRARARVTW